MIIDCDGCGVRGAACSDCVVSVLLGMPGLRDGAAGVPEDGPGAEGPRGAGVPELEESERVALGVLAGSGLVPPLRLLPTPSSGGGAPGTEGTGSYDHGRGAGRDGRGRTSRAG